MNKPSMGDITADAKERIHRHADEEKGRGKVTVHRKGRTVQIIANPPKGERAEFFNITLRLSPEIMQELQAESLRRRTTPGSGTVTHSGIIRDALVAYLGKKN